ncbi:hypothetical protein SDJN02_11575 [Cucurbita argyrosperma subsp. argyrosperma]|nr:hypothetical protein SDJN02_11575 [Cucurbita argyrosperma subsp. argyrosperma]
MMQFTKSQSTTIEIADPKLGDLNSMFFLLRHALFDHYTCKSDWADLFVGFDLRKSIILIEKRTGFSIRWLLSICSTYGVFCWT